MATETPPTGPAAPHLPGKLASRKLWVAIITAVVMLAAQLTGLDLKPEQWLPVLLPLIGYILGEAWVDASRAGAP